jgi:hypothetical protein
MVSSTPTWLRTDKVVWWWCKIHQTSVYSCMRFRSVSDYSKSTKLSTFITFTYWDLDSLEKAAINIWKKCLVFQHNYNERRHNSTIKKLANKLSRKFGMVYLFCCTRRWTSTITHSIHTIITELTHAIQMSYKGTSRPLALAVLHILNYLYNNIMMYSVI